MRYTLFLYSDETAFADATPEDMDQALRVFGDYINQLKEAGVFVDTEWLQPSATATTITKVGGERKIQDGPYADTKEQLGGTFVIDVPDLDAAMAWAEKCPNVHYGIVEVRATAMPEGGNPYAG
ncbi:dgpf domain-containing protein [Roseibium sp. TrichSKD4]|uniref:YciI family protein n=1 Tax=Roseibium sp. TrichSKD4 TaxID=744980 RepID=UPI0001E56B6E|nr:YciI family protein [Roseibium sp. TrichSKD4]EFO30708.1 dgpf domain-containing protein [Roseibium sp. TrichSKD4]